MTSNRNADTGAAARVSKSQQLSAKVAGVLQVRATSALQRLTDRVQQATEQHLVASTWPALSGLSQTAQAPAAVVVA